MTRIVVYRAGRPGGRLSLRDRLGLALAGVLALAVLVAVLVVSFLVAIPLIAVLLVLVGRVIWRVRADVRRARRAGPADAPSAWR